MTRSCLLAATLTTLVAASCVAEKDVPTADDGAAQLGLMPGSVLSYSAGAGLTETHEVRESGVLFQGGFAVDVIATKNGGFAENARTYSLGIDVERVSFVRFLDCLASCAQPAEPIAFLNWPLAVGDVVEGESLVTETSSSATTTRTERHRTTVGGATTITVPAGEFEAFPITWSRTITDANGSATSETALLHIATDVGVVKEEAFDGTTVLELVSRTGP
jgi:hypothetical protein